MFFFFLIFYFNFLYTGIRYSRPLGESLVLGQSGSTELFCAISSATRILRDQRELEFFFGWNMRESAASI